LSPLNLAIASFFALVIAALVLGERREVRSPSLVLLRGLFPAWRFFESLEPGPLLRYRVASPDGELGPWIDALPAPAARRLFLNAAENFRLACQSLVEQCADELEAQPAEPAQSVAFRLLDHLVQYRMRAAGPVGRGARYQFQLSERGPELRELFVSPVISA
jgi:hypothetical protein